MRRIRVIPTLLLKDGGLVKTKKFANPKYIGDPINSLKIFNQKEVDEIILLDINASIMNISISLDNISKYCSECFMPLAYGGGISKIDQIEKILSAGAEKVIINSASIEKSNLISDAASRFGSQSIVVSIDVKKSFFNKYLVYTHSGTKRTNKNALEHAINMESEGAGEIFLNSIDLEGTFLGYDLKLIKLVSEVVNIPVISCGGARDLNDFYLAIKEGKASAVAAGSKFVFQGKHNAVLINYPNQSELIEGLYKKL